MNNMEKLHIVTVATHDDGYYQALMQSAKNNNLNLTTLGWGQKWTGFTMKYNLLKEHINNLEDNDIVVFVDAYDVLILDNEENIKTKFHSFNKPIVLSVDGKPHFFLHNYLHSLLFKSCNNEKINSGLYMGYVWAIKILLNKICNNKLMSCDSPQADDQMLLINVCNSNDFYDKYIAIDTNKLLFYNTFGNSNLDNLYQDFNFNESNIIVNNKLVLKNYNTTPSFIHGPGNTNLNTVCKLYNLPILNVNKRDLAYRIKVYTKPEYLKIFVTELVYYYQILIIIFISIVYFYKK